MSIAEQALRILAPSVQNIAGFDDLPFAADEFVCACQVFFRRSRRESQRRNTIVNVNALIVSSDFADCVFEL